VHALSLGRYAGLYSPRVWHVKAAACQEYIGRTRKEDTMGRYTRSIGLIVAAFVLGIATVALGAPPAEAPSPSGETVEIAQATEEAQPTCEPAERIGICGNTKGIVYYYDDRRPEAWVTLGANDGLRVGARVEFMRGGQVVASGTATTVRTSDCVVYPDKEVPGGAIDLGDSVSVTENGSRRAARAAIARESKKDALLTVLMSGLLTYLILI
jgi:hypothetical protein